MNKAIKILANEKYVKEIVTDYDKLSERCDEFDLIKSNTEVQEVVLALKNTIRFNEGMLGLSANQIGFNKRIFCLNFNGNIKTFINPIITSAEGLELSKETCHSIPGKTFIRTRNSKISVTYQTPLGKIESVDLIGVAAKEFQHHIDHLDGLLLSDVSLEIDEEFDNASQEEKEEVIKFYLDSLDLFEKDLKQDLKNDPESKQMADAIDFINSVKSGETIIEKYEWTEEEIEEFKKSQEENKEVESNDSNEDSNENNTN